MMAMLEIVSGVLNDASKHSQRKKFLDIFWELEKNLQHSKDFFF